MATEPIQGGPYPVPADPPDGPNQMSAIVTWAASRVVMRFASIAARTAALPAPTIGMLCHLASDGGTSENGLHVYTGPGTGVGGWTPLSDTLEPVTATSAIGASGNITSTALIPAPNSTWTWTPSRTGLGTVRAEIYDIPAATTGFGYLVIQLQIDGVSYAQTRVYEGSPRTSIILDSTPFRVVAGAPRVVRLGVGVYTAAGTARIGEGSWRATVV